MRAKKRFVAGAGRGCENIEMWAPNLRAGRVEDANANWGKDAQ